MTEIRPDTVKQWEADCIRWRGKMLNGYHAHWCIEWDGLPVDETTPEWPCGCGEGGPPSPFHKPDTR